MATRMLTLGLAALVLALPTPETARAQESIPPQTLKINEFIAQAWADNELKPSPKTDDLSFLRRAFIDIIGRIPTVEEVYDFEQDRSADKRAKVVRRLLQEKKYRPTYGGRPISVGDGKVLEFDYTEEFASHFADVWTVWLMTRTTPEIHRTQMHLWLTEKLMENITYKDLTVQLLTATGKGNENGAVNFIGSHLGEMLSEQERNSGGIYDSVPITSRVTRLFLGLQTQCTQCHDHPFNPEWKQDNFWGVNAFFRQVKRNPPTLNNQDMMATYLEVSDDKSLNRTAAVYFERRSGIIDQTTAQFLRDLGADPFDTSIQPKTIPLASQKSRRELLAEYVTGHDNYEKAYVNRIWAMLFGRGLNELPAADDFGEHNPVVHEDLLNYLAEQFEEYNHDTKSLIEWICNSDAYQLTYRAIPGVNDMPEAVPFFTRMPMKAMSPEQIYESLMTALGAHYDKNREARAEARQTFMSKLVDNFGDDEGNEVNFNGTVIQALLMMNGTELNSELDRNGERHPIDRAVSRGMKYPGAQAQKEYAMIDTLYVSALGRHARPSETQLIARELLKYKAQLASNPNAARDPAKAYRPFFEDVYWALLNTNEFILNH